MDCPLPDNRSRESNIDPLRVLAVFVFSLLVAGPGLCDQIVTSDAVSSYVNIREKPTTDSAIIGALRAGKGAPLVSESEEWFAIELSGGRVGYVSRYWTQKTASGARQPERRIYTETPAAPAADTLVGALRDRTVLVQASALLEQGRAREAYAMLSQLELEWGGDAGFDYLLGVAALDSGHAGEAVFSLERVIRSLPGFVGARLDLARALYEVGDRDRAKDEFESLLDSEPPDEVRGVITAYLDALSEPEPDRGRPEKIFYAAASGGYDSNANGAADITDFLMTTLDPRSTEQDTPFVEALLGGLGARPLTGGIDLLWRGDLKHRHNPDADFVDQTFVNTTAALGFSMGRSEIITGIGAYWSALDSRFNERSIALDLGWSRPVGDNAVQLTLRAGPVEFQDAQKIRNIDRVLYTFTLRQPIQGGSGTFDWTLIGGRDRAENRASAYSNTRHGGRIGASWKLAAGNVMFDAGFLKIPYNGNSSFFGIDREDEQITTRLSIEIQDKPVQGWVFVPNLRYVKNTSNVPIFDYDRVEVGVSFRVAR